MLSQKLLLGPGRFSTVTFIFASNVLAAIVLTIIAPLTRMPLYTSDDVGAYNVFTTRLCLPYMLPISILNGVLGQGGAVATLRRLPPLVVSVSLTVVPTLSILVGAMIGASPMPHWTTMVGGGVLTCGILCVVIYGSKQKKTGNA